MYSDYVTHVATLAFIVNLHVLMISKFFILGLHFRFNILICMFLFFTLLILGLFVFGF